MTKTDITLINPGCVRVQYLGEQFVWLINAASKTRQLLTLPWCELCKFPNTGYFLVLSLGINNLSWQAVMEKYNL